MNIGHPFQVGNGPCDLQDPGMRSCAETESIHRFLQNLTGVGIELAEFSDLPAGHTRIGVGFCSIEAVGLVAPS